MVGLLKNPSLSEGLLLDKSGEIDGLLNTLLQGFPEFASGVLRGESVESLDKLDEKIAALGIEAPTEVEEGVVELSCLSLGLIGIRINGGYFFNALDARGRDAVAHEIQDICQGHPEVTGAYHYHNVTSCLEDANGHGHSKQSLPLSCNLGVSLHRRLLSEYCHRASLLDSSAVMLTQEQTQLLTTLRSLVTLTECEAIEVVRLFQTLTLNQNVFWVCAGDIPQTIGFVVSGILRLYCTDAKGNEFTKSFCAENSFVAAYSALLLKQPSHLFIQALKDTRLLVADYSTYRKQYHIASYLGITPVSLSRVRAQLKSN